MHARLRLACAGGVRVGAAVCVRRRALAYASGSSAGGSAASSVWQTQEEGGAGGGAGDALQYRMYFVNRVSGRRVSPWHDIPLFGGASGELIHFVNEIPQGTSAKMEIDKRSKHNPIRQDVKNGKPRFVTYSAYPFNYGAAPQTYEDPQHVDADVRLAGDDDPLDVVEVGGVPLPRGAVLLVRPLGVIGLIDEGACDYKILAVDAARTDMRTLADLGHARCEQIAEWFRLYKTADGKPPNTFAFGAVRGVDAAMTVVLRAHQQWQMMSGRATDTA